MVSDNPRMFLFRCTQRPWAVRDDFGLADSETRQTDLNGRIIRILLIQNGKLVSRLFQMVRLPKLAFRSIQLVFGNSNLE